ncbi:MAG: hypothetical protein FWG16_03170 [Micrococcales bacterium]|nr:hypothetical protein [Micrococcales bacterium]
MMLACLAVVLQAGTLNGCGVAGNVHPAADGATVQGGLLDGDPLIDGEPELVRPECTDYDPGDVSFLLDEDSFDSRFGMDSRAAFPRMLLGDNYCGICGDSSREIDVLSVFSLADADHDAMDELESWSHTEIVECPVARAELNAAMELALDVTGELWSSVDPDYTNGRVYLGVIPGNLEKAFTILQKETVLRPVFFGQVYPESERGSVVIVIGAAEREVLPEP